MHCKQFISIHFLHNLWLTYWNPAGHFLIALLKT